MNLNPRTCWQVMNIYLVTTYNVLSDSSFQELKDFGRLAGGTVAFCDIDKTNRQRGYDRTVLGVLILYLIFLTLGSWNTSLRTMQIAQSGSSTVESS